MTGTAKLSPAPLPGLSASGSIKASQEKDMMNGPSSNKVCVTGFHDTNGMRWRVCDSSATLYGNMPKVYVAS